MNQDEFESRLRQQCLRLPPEAWRQEILDATMDHLPTSDAPGSISWRLRLRELFWPNPVAWGALAAVWVAIGLVYLAVREPWSHRTPSYLAISPDAPTVILLQREGLASLEEANNSEKVKPLNPLPPQSCLEATRDTRQA